MVLTTHLDELNNWYDGLRFDDNCIQFLAQLEVSLGLTFVPEPDEEGNICMANSPEVRDDYKTTFTRIDLLDYIYAILHSPSYFETYSEFLKICLLGVPYPKKAKTFWHLVTLGGKLRQLHLLESPKVEEFNSCFPIDGDNIITRRLTQSSPGFEPAENKVLGISTTRNTGSGEGQAGKVWINETQYFDNVPQVAWEFHMGGDQPAQKWLKDRKGKTLDHKDIRYFQKIIVALSETDRLMKKIGAMGIG